MEKRVNKQKEHDRKLAEMALSSIDVVIEHTDLFGRNVPFRWPNGRDVIHFEEHKEIMKTLLYWKREVEVYKDLYIDAEEGG
jgi:hypothetical protein